MSTAHSTTAAPQGKPKPPPRREQVLVLAHGDGFLEVFGDRHIDCRIVMMPFVDGDQAAEIEAERYIESILPWCYRDVFCPGNLRAAAMHQRIRPSDIARRNGNMELLRAIERAGEIIAAGVAEVAS